MAFVFSKRTIALFQKVWAIFLLLLYLVFGSSRFAAFIKKDIEKSGLMRLYTVSSMHFKLLFTQRKFRENFLMSPLFNSFLVVHKILQALI